MRTLDDIVPPSRRREPAAEVAADHAPLRSKQPKRFPYLIAIIALLAVAIAGVTIWYFSGAEVDVIPTLTSVSAAGNYTATASATGDALSFQVVTANKIATQSVASSGSTNVSASAQGTITISNAQSTTQRLITNTRFQSTSGLIFRIHAPVSIPAGGSVQATVYADQPGATYNIDPTSFTVPGLTGVAHTQVTAMSAAPMTGGASGPQPSIDPSVLTSTRTALDAALSPDLANQLSSLAPAGYVILPGSATTTYQSLQPVPSATSGMVDVKEEGTVTAVALPNAALAKTIATSAASSVYAGQPVVIQNPNDLTLTPVSSFPTAGSSSFSFTLAGTAQLLATIDQNQIASAIAGKSRDQAGTALLNYPSVKQVVLNLRPFWVGSFPQDPAAIKVVVENP